MEDISIRDIEKSIKSRGYYLTEFLTYPQKLDIIKEINSNGLCSREYTSEFELERTRLLIYDKSFDEDQICNEKFETSILKVIPNKFAKGLLHKDYLGSILACGIKREKLGDIIIGKEYTIFFISSNLKDYLLSTMDRIGREKVSISELHYMQDDFAKEDGFKEKVIIVKSLRADGIVSHAFNISRSVSAGLFEKELVKLNHIEIASSKKELNAGDVISVRGYGRLTIEEVLGSTKKGSIKLKTILSKSKRGLSC